MRVAPLIICTLGNNYKDRENRNVGRRVAEILVGGFGSRAAGHSLSMLTDVPGVEVLSLEEAFRQSDYGVTLTPLNGNTYAFVNAERLALMKSTTYLVNASGGGVIDEKALAETLWAGRIAGAALDVFATELVASDQRFFELSNLTLISHIADLSVEKFRELSLRPVAEVDRKLLTVAADCKNPD
ncbi:uncharacterized protein METZ01_LOCUS418338, partial [marine metagenome]